MTSAFVTGLVAAAFCVTLAAGVGLRRRSFAAWCFAAGMMVLAAESTLGALSFLDSERDAVNDWHRMVLFTRSLLPFPWLAFSLSYLRGDIPLRLHRWRWILAAALVLPLGLVWGFQDHLVVLELPKERGGWWIEYGKPAQLLNILLMFSCILFLTNLEKTLRAAVGTSRWKIKFAMLGLGLVFGARIYTTSQTLLFSGYDLDLMVVETISLILGCALMAVSLARQGFGEIDIYPSRAVLQSSVTVILAGGYLFLVGVLAQLAKAMGGAGSFQFQAFVVLAAAAILATLLLSDRLRLRLRSFVSRHFRRPQHDSRALWSAFTHRLSTVTDSRTYCGEAVKLVAESFQALSVTIWLHDQRMDALIPVASSVDAVGDASEPVSFLTPASPILEGLRKLTRPIDLDRDGPAWAQSLRTANQPYFQKGGSRLGLPLVAGDRALGALTLVDRVDGVSYTTEELDLLKCIGEQLAAGLLQFQLTEEIMQSRELEAFQAMSTFFVHDLKNATSSLSLMLQNLPMHFDDPEFRKDALRGIGSTVDRINQIISRLTSLRQKLDLITVETDLSQVVNGAVAGFHFPGEIEVIRDLQPGTTVMADPERLESVVTNLLLNASEAIAPAAGRITVRTTLQGDSATLSVADTGCGMSAAFVRESLFRPFHTTKKKGLGIGMFQCRMIINAHRGSMHVESEPGQGTTFRILLPLAPKPL